MVGWHHQLNTHGFGWTLGVGDGQGGLACCGSWGCKESDMTLRLNCTVRHSNEYNFACLSFLLPIFCIFLSLEILDLDCY